MSASLIQNTSIISCLNDTVEIGDSIECDVSIPSGTSINITDTNGANEWQIEGMAAML